MRSTVFFRRGAALLRSVFSIRLIGVVVLIVALMPSIPGTQTSLAQAATVTNVTNGNWSSSATWGGGSIPQTGDAVVIAPGTTVVYDVVSDEIIAGVTVFGTLQSTNLVN